MGKGFALPRSKPENLENASLRSRLAYAAKQSKADEKLRKFSWDKTDERRK